MGWHPDGTRSPWRCAIEAQASSGKAAPEVVCAGNGILLLSCIHPCMLRALVVQKKTTLGPQIRIQNPAVKIQLYSCQKSILRTSKFGVFEYEYSNTRYEYSRRHYSL